MLAAGRNCPHPQALRRQLGGAPNASQLLAARRRSSVKASTSSVGLSPAALGVLQQAEKVDRLRYQARLIFDRLDTDKDGLLQPTDLDTYGRFCQEALGAASVGVLQPLAEAAAATGGASGGMAFHQFAGIVRAQVRSMQDESGRLLLNTRLGGSETGRLIFKSSLSPPELAAALLVFTLLDGDRDGRLRLEELQRAQGIEKKVVEDVLEDADADEDGLLSFEDFLVSYHKEKPVFQNMFVLLAHSAFFWGVLNLPLEVPLKAVLVAVALIKPSIITNPVIKIFQIGKAIYDRLRATRAVAMGGA